MDKKKIKMVNRAYAFKKVKTNDILKLLDFFKVENVFVEIININKDSSFYKTIQRRKKGYDFFSNPTSEIYTDIFISGCLGESFADMLDEIIDSCPEMLLFYLTNLSLEDFLRYNRKTLDGRMITKQVAACVFEIMFDEKAFLISFDSSLFCQSDLISKIDEIFIKA